LPHASPEAERAYRREQYRTRPKVHKARALRKYASPRSRSTYMLCTARRRALEKGLAFDLTHEWIYERVAKGVCEVTGIPFVLTGEGKNRPWSPSLDRIDPSQGYTRDNVQVVCWMYNAAKGVAGHEDVLKLAEALCTQKQS
jgi:hypothetical protein